MEVKLDAFEGPLALLMHLIERSEIDIYDIPIAELTDQYMAVIKTYPGDMDGMSEFILMAATLLEIKSRMLLPKPPSPSDEEGEDPRETLVRKLLEYKRCQTLAEHLKSNTAPGMRVVRAGERKSYHSVPGTDVLMGDVSLEMLQQLFTEVIRRRELRIDHVRAHYGDMPRERFTMEEKIVHIERYLKRRGRFSLTELFEACATRGEMVVTFLALLELIRVGKLRVKQNKAFGDIDCETREDQACPVNG